MSNFRNLSVDGKRKKGKISWNKGAKIDFVSTEGFTTHFVSFAAFLELKWIITITVPFADPDKIQNANSHSDNSSFQIFMKLLLHAPDIYFISGVINFIALGCCYFLFSKKFKIGDFGFLELMYFKNIGVMDMENGSLDR